MEDRHEYEVNVRIIKDSDRLDFVINRTNLFDTNAKNLAHIDWNLHEDKEISHGAASMRDDHAPHRFTL